MRNYGEVLAKFETEKEATCPFLFAPSHTQFLVYCNLSFLWVHVCGASVMDACHIFLFQVSKILE